MNIDLNVDIPKVKGKMAEKGYTNCSLAEELDINRNTLASYFVEPGKMPLDIVQRMADALCDTHNEAVAIFFAPKLTQKES